MLTRACLWTALVLFSSALAIAGPKKKDELPAYVLKAHTVAVIIDPSVGASGTSVPENIKAKEEVEQALMKWGRLGLSYNVQSADLVIVIGKGTGRLVEVTVAWVPTSVPQQTVPRDTDAGPLPLPQDARPQKEAAPLDDTFFVYKGHSQLPVDQRPLFWRYSNKNALRSPDVPAVTEFRKAIEATEKQQPKSNP
jgi:hypothetical protein